MSLRVYTLSSSNSCLEPGVDKYEVVEVTSRAIKFIHSGKQVCKGCITVTHLYSTTPWYTKIRYSTAVFKFEMLI